MLVDLRKNLDQISRERKALEEPGKIKGLISVCIPNHNKGKFVRECIASVGKQNHIAVEMIIVDDASTDNSMNEIRGGIIDNWQPGWSYEIYQSKRRLGNAWAQNMAYYLSKGEYIANMDSDDTCHPDRLAHQLHFLKSNNLDIVGCNFSIISDDSTTPPVSNGGYWLKWNTEEIKEAYYNDTHAMCFGTCLFKSEIIDVIGGLTKRYVGTEDWDFINRAIKAGYQPGNLQRVLYRYRNHETQRSKLFHKN